MGIHDDDSSCNTVLILGLPFYHDGATRPPATVVAAPSPSGEYERRRPMQQPKLEQYHLPQPQEEERVGIVVPSLTLALSAEVSSCYGTSGNETENNTKPTTCNQPVDVDHHPYSSPSAIFSQRHHQQYASCCSLSLSSTSTFSNSCLSTGGAAVKRERGTDAAPHQPVRGDDDNEVDADADVENAALTSSHAGPSGAVDDVDGDAATCARKKLRLTKDQSTLLEERFKEHSTLNPKQKLVLAKQLNLRPRQVEVWFQNRRARTKLKQTEVDCEFLRRCCETLADENRRLHRELQELKAINLTAAASAATMAAPHPKPLYLQVPIPQTAAAAAAAFTMCPGCQRISATPGNEILINQTAANSATAAAAFAVAPKSAHVM